MKKKILIAFLILSAVALIFASCGECKHEEYEVKSTVDATCVADGKIISACKECGEEKVDVVPKNGNHKMSYTEIGPTCKEAGKTVGTCSVEGCTFTTETAGKPKLGTCSSDTLDDVVTKEPSCTEDGKKMTVCTICEKEQWNPNLDSKIPALGHTYDRSGFATDEEKGETFVPGRCEVEGYFARVCKDCGYDKDPITRDEYAKMPGYDTIKYDQMEALVHNYAQFVENVPPTCTEDGYELYKCTREGCDGEDRRPTDYATGHIYNKGANAVLGTDYVITLEPTCINTGIKAYKCSVCGEVATNDEDTESISTVEHSFVEDDQYLIVGMDATCTDSAYKVFKCNSDLGCTEEKKFTYGEPLNHKWEVSAEPSCATGGKTYYVCSNVCNGEACPEDKYDDPSKEIKHQFGSLVSQPTCVADAMYKCKVCGNNYPAYDDDTEGQAHGNHDYSILFDTIAPTCSSEGYNIYSCAAGECGTYYGDDENEKDRNVTARIDHIFNPVTEDGKIVCTVCLVSYRDVTTEITSGSKELCFNCGKTPCDCGLVVEWNGYVSPKDPEELKANETLKKTETVWSEVVDEPTAIPLAIGNGMIVLNGEDATTYVVKVYDKVDGTLLATIERSGSVAFVDLYKYAEVGQVEITASTDGYAYFYAIID